MEKLEGLEAHQQAVSQLDPSSRNRSNWGFLSKAFLVGHKPQTNLPLAKVATKKQFLAKQIRDALASAEESKDGPLEEEEKENIIKQITSKFRNSMRVVAEDREFATPFEVAAAKNKIVEETLKLMVKLDLKPELDRTGLPAINVIQGHVIGAEIKY